MMKFLRLSVLFFLPLLASAQTQQDTWSDWKFLLGEWSAGESSGVPGQASKGWFSLAPDLDGKVLVRKNHAEYPADNGRPAHSHDDLMIVYHEGNTSKAFYTDNEGHVIHYVVTCSADKKQIVFLSDPASPGPQFRLTYQDLQAGTVKVLFEIAPPGKPGQFAKYVEATVRRKQT